MVFRSRQNSSSTVPPYLSLDAPRLTPSASASSSSASRPFYLRRFFNSFFPSSLTPSRRHILAMTTSDPSALPTSAPASAPSSSATVAYRTVASYFSPAMFDNFRANAANVDLKTAAAMALNFFSSTMIVIVNKIVMEKYGFRFAVTLTCYHLWATFLLLLLTSKLGVFEIKKLPIKDVSKLAVGTMGFITLTNLSLQHNTIGFYQVMKVMTTPTVVLIEALLYQKYLENTLKISLIPVCVGVIITTVTEVRLNAVGAAYSVAGVIATSFYQIWSGTLQRSLDCNALQLQTYVAPLAAMFVMPFIPILDKYSMTDPASIWFFNFTPINSAVIAITGFFGFLVNVSIFLVIGRSSPVSYNILGHCKTTFVLLSDFIWFGRRFTFKSSFGIVLTLLGVFWYTSLKLEKARLEKEARERAESKISESKQDILEEEKIELVNSREK